MNIEERKKRNEELERNAPIPIGIENLIGITWINKYNQSVIEIVRSRVTNTGLVCWYSGTDEMFFTRELNNHWRRVSKEEE
jgi:hypothetical protein